MFGIIIIFRLVDFGAPSPVTLQANQAVIRPKVGLTVGINISGEDIFKVQKLDSRLGGKAFAGLGLRRRRHNLSPRGGSAAGPKPTCQGDVVIAASNKSPVAFQ